MELITISGNVVTDSEKCVDKNGREYVRFRVSCWSKDYQGYDKYTYYNCFCYHTGYGKMKKGEIVFLSGTYMQNVKYPEDQGKKIYINNDIFVQHLTKVPAFNKTIEN